jgi:tetratricopeptide (TPR) repeat protein
VPDSEIDVLLWQLYIDMAEAAFSLGDLGQTTEMLLRAAEHAQRFGPNDERLAATLNRLGVVFFYQHKHGTAKALVERALGILEEINTDPTRKVTLLYNLIGIYDAEGNFAKAESICENARRILEEGPASREPELALTLLKLGEIHLAQDRPLQAIFALRHALEILESRIGSPRPCLPESATST